MNRFALACIAPLMLLSSTASAQKNALNLFIWSEYIDPKIISQFEKEFDCKVTVDLYEDNEAMMAKLMGGGISQYDVIVPSDYIIPALLKEGLLAPLRAENVPNLKNLDPRFANREYDPGNKYSVPYQWGTSGIFVRKAKGETLDESWGLLFDPAKKAGSFLLLEDARTTIGAALLYKGKTVNSTEKVELKEAREVILGSKKRSVGFDGSVGGKNKVLATVAKMAMVFNGDAVRGMAEDPDTYYFVPKEGSEIWLDNLAIPAKAPHRDLAEKFVNYILDAKIGAQLSNFNRYASPNKAALAYVKPEDLKNPVIYPPPEVMKRLHFLTDLGAKTQWYDELWTSIKAK
ncbi:MAG: spermidine/putrescine ABC transporter substrate-binding protein [Myxococcales bacterium]